MNSIAEMVLMIIAGGLLGTCGQGIRVCLGLAKRRLSFREFSWFRLTVTLLLGFALGGLGVSLLMRNPILVLSSENIFLLIIFGYAGGDIIERSVKLVVQRSAGDRQTIGRTTEAPQLIWGWRFDRKSRPYDL